MATNSATTSAKEDRADASTAELQEQILALKTDIAELSASLARYGKAQSEALKAQARDGLRKATEKGTEGLVAASDYAGQKYAETEDYVRANPAASVGIAAGIGFLVGLLTARR